MSHLIRVKGGWRTRIRCGTAGQRYVTIALEDETAQTRAYALTKMAKRLVGTGKHAEAVVILRRGAVETTEAGFADVEAVARDLCKNARAKKSTVPVGDP